jgi:putative FmdB family regulatory protein
VPIYEYRCPNGHTFELFQRMTDPQPEACEACGASPVERVLYPVAVHYKGSGFYSTDYGRGGRKAAGRDGGDSSSGASSSGESSSGESSSGPGESGAGEKKAAAADGP